MASKQGYVPKRGDFIWIDFDPQAGREQRGQRPGLVISPVDYNKTNMALVCPITNQVKGYPFEVVIPSGLAVTGAVLSDHIKCLDWKARNATHKGQATPALFREVMAKLSVLIN